MRRTKPRLIDFEKVRRRQDRPDWLFEALGELQRLYEENRLESIALCFDYRDPKDGIQHTGHLWSRRDDGRGLVGSVELLKFKALSMVDAEFDTK